MATVEIVPLEGVRLDPEAGVLRDFTRPEHLVDDAFRAAYDRTSLVYDCVWRRDLGRHVMNAPPMLNLWPVLRDGLRRDGTPVTGLRRRASKRSEQIFAPGPEGTLSVDVAGRCYALPVRPSQRDRFAGLNCIMSLSRNNPLRWVRDWARFYVNRHGAQGAVVFDNGSDAYQLAEIAAALSSVPGLQAATVYSAPFSYGVNAGRLRFGWFRKEREFRCLQTTMFNMAKSDAFAAARAVLNVDIDELVDGPADASIFDAAVRHPLGMVTTKGYYAYPERPDMIPADHAAHRYRATNVRKCNRKWCVVPTGPIGRNFTWDIHQLGGILQNAFTEQTAFFHHHCYGCTTGWKAQRTTFDTEIVRDPGLDDLMDRYLPPLGEAEAAGQPA